MEREKGRVGREGEKEGCEREEEMKAKTRRTRQLEEESNEPLGIATAGPILNESGNEGDVKSAKEFESSERERTRPTHPMILGGTPA